MRQLSGNKDITVYKFLAGAVYVIKQVHRANTSALEWFIRQQKRRKCLLHLFSE
jgi:hypothetical protein